MCAGRADVEGFGRIERAGGDQHPVHGGCAAPSPPRGCGGARRLPRGPRPRGPLTRCPILSPAPDRAGSGRSGDVAQDSLGAPPAQADQPAAGPLVGIRFVELGGISGPVPHAAMVLGGPGCRRGPGAAARRFHPPRRLRSRDSICCGAAGCTTGSTCAPPRAGQLLGLVARADLLIEGFRPGVAERPAWAPRTASRATPPGLRPDDRLGPGRSARPRGRARHQLLGLAGALGAMGPRRGPPVPAEPGWGHRRRLDAGRRHAGRAAASAADRPRSGGRRGNDRRRPRSLRSSSGCAHAGAGPGPAWRQPARRRRPVLPHLPVRRRALRGGGGDGAAVLRRGCRASTSTRPPCPRSSTRAAGPPCGLFTARFLQRTRDEWAAVLEPLEACVTPVLTMDEVADHPQVAAGGTSSPSRTPVPGAGNGAALRPAQHRMTYAAGVTDPRRRRGEDPSRSDRQEDEPSGPLPACAQAQPMRQVSLPASSARRSPAPSATAASSCSDHLVVDRPLDVAEDADRGVVQRVRVGQPGQRERRRRVPACASCTRMSASSGARRRRRPPASPVGRIARPRPARPSAPKRIGCAVLQPDHHVVARRRCPSAARRRRR